MTAAAPATCAPEETIGHTGDIDDIDDSNDLDSLPLPLLPADDRTSQRIICSNLLRAYGRGDWRIVRSVIRQLLVKLLSPSTA